MNEPRTRCVVQNCNTSLFTNILPFQIPIFSKTGNENAAQLRFEVSPLYDAILPREKLPSDFLVRIIFFIGHFLYEACEYAGKMFEFSRSKILQRAPVCLT